MKYKLLPTIGLMSLVFSGLVSPDEYRAKEVSTNLTLTNETQANEAGISATGVDTAKLETSQTDSASLNLLEPASGKNPASQLEAILADLQNFRSGFRQTVHEQDGYLLDEQSGILQFAQPGKLYWRTLDPFASTLVADGEQIYYFDPDLNQVNIREWDSDPSQNPIAVFIGDSAISDYYRVSRDESDFLLEPLFDGSSILQLKLGFEAGQPRAMEMMDSLGQRTRIEFHQLQQNLNAVDGSEYEAGEESDDQFPPSPFVFEVPEDAEIITDG